MSGGGAPTLPELRSDLVLAPFFDESFNGEAYVRSVIRSEYNSGAAAAGLEESAAETALARVRQKTQDVEKAIKALVSTHQDALFAQAGTTVALKRTVGAVSERVAGMQAVSLRLREDVLMPLRELRSEAATLANVLAVSDIMRRVQRLHYNVRRLRALTAPSGPARGAQGDDATAAAIAAPTIAPEKLSDLRSLARIAPLLHEVEDGLADPVVAGVAVIEGERPFVGAVGLAVRDATRSILLKSVDSLNAADCSAALAVFHELHCVPDEVASAIDRAAASAVASIRDALDVKRVIAAAQSAIEGGGGSGGGDKGKGGVGISLVGMSMSIPGAASRGGPLLPPAGAAAAWRGALWGRVESLCEALQRTTLQVWNLLYIVSRTRDAAAAAASAGASRRDSMIGAIAAALAAGARGDPAGVQRHPSESSSSDSSSGGAGEAPSGPPLPSASPSSDATAAGGGGEVPHPAVALLLRYWRAVATGLAAEVSSVSSSESLVFVRNTLVDSYPRLHYLLLDSLLARTGRSVSLRSSDDDVGVAGGSAGAAAAAGGLDLQVILFGGAARRHTKQHDGRGRGEGGGGAPPISGSSLFLSACSPRSLVWAVAPLFRLYLARVLSRFTEPLAAMFPPNAPRPRIAPPRPPPPASAQAGPFTPNVDMDRYMDESYPDPPSLAAVSAFCRALSSELAACRPAAGTGMLVGRAGGGLAQASASSPTSSASSSSGGGGGGYWASAASVPGMVMLQGGGGSGTNTASSTAPVMVDPALYGAVAKSVSTAVKLFTMRAEETAAVSSPSATCVSEHWMPSPAQYANLSLVSRIDEARRALVRAASEVPSPVELERLCAAADSDVIVRTLASRRTLITPLRTPLPPSLLIIDALLARAGRVPAGATAEPAPAAAAAPGGGGSSSGGEQQQHHQLQKGGGSGGDAGGDEQAAAHAKLVAVARVSAAGYLLDALAGLDALVEALLIPWLSAVAAPLESTLLRMHELSYSSAPVTDAATSSASSSSSSSQPKGGDVSSSSAAASAVSASAASVLGESDYVRELEHHAASLSRHQLSLLPGGHLTDVIRGALAVRLLSQFVRSACLLRPLDDGGKMRLTRDGAHLESNVVPHLWPDLPRLGRSYAELRALRPFLFMASSDLLAAVAASDASSSSSAAAPAAAAGLLSAVAPPDAARQRKILTLLRALGTANVLHALTARLPRDCPLPHQQQGQATPGAALTAYLQSLDSVAVAAVLGGIGSGSGSVARLFPLSDAAYAALDTAVLSRVRECVEAYAQRVSIATAGGGGGGASASPEYVIITRYAQLLLERGHR